LPLYFLSFRRSFASTPTQICQQRPWLTKVPTMMCLWQRLTDMVSLSRTISSDIPPWKGFKQASCRRVILARVSGYFILGIWNIPEEYHVPILMLADSLSSQGVQSRR
jgi:hypothetical protein